MTNEPIQKLGWYVIPEEPVTDAGENHASKSKRRDDIGRGVFKGASE